jgi:hypothetical protein
MNWISLADVAPNANRSSGSDAGLIALMMVLVAVVLVLVVVLVIRRRKP